MEERDKVVVCVSGGWGAQHAEGVTQKGWLLSLKEADPGPQRKADGFIGNSDGRLHPGSGLSGGPLQS